MAIQPGALETADTSSLPSIWSHYEKKLCDVKKGVEDQIDSLGFQGVSFDQESISSKDSKVMINTVFHGKNHETFASKNIVLVGDNCKSLNVQKLVELLVAQAKTIRVNAMKNAVSIAQSISKKNIGYCGENSSAFVVGYFEEELKESDYSLIMEIPKKNVICRSSEDMAQYLVAEFANPCKLEKEEEYVIIEITDK